MSVGLRLGFSQLTLGDYDKVCEALNFPSDWPQGLQAHASYEIDGLLVVSDVWESRQQFDSFVEQRLQAAMGQALGDRGEQPEVTERQLHTFYTR
jgi:hypothetical protein